MINCNKFEKSFTKLSSLNHHKLNTHAAKFKCHLCDLEVVNSKFLNVHKASKHSKTPIIKNVEMKANSEKIKKGDKVLMRGGAVFECEECGNISQNKEDLNNHIENNHGDISPRHKTEKKKTQQ